MLGEFGEPTRRIREPGDEIARVRYEGDRIAKDVFFELDGLQMHISSAVSPLWGVVAH